MENVSIEIQSDVTIQATSGLEYNDLTVKDSDIKDRMKVQAMWKRCLIKKGKALYPIEVSTWPTVKALEKDGILTIGKKSTEQPVAKIEGLSSRHKVEAVEKKPEQQNKVKVVKDLTLEEVAEK